MAAGGSPAQHDTRAWFEEWNRLLDELTRSRDRVALLLDGAVDGSVRRLEALVEEVFNVGEVVRRLESPEQVLDAIKPRASSVLLVDIEVLFSPELGLDVMAFIRHLSHGRALIVEWPGGLSSGRLTYSRPGRRDYFDQPVRDLVVLRPTESVFPDEAPFRLERYPA